MSAGLNFKGGNMFYPIDLGWILITAAAILVSILVIKGIGGWNEK